MAYDPRTMTEEEAERIGKLVAAERIAQGLPPTIQDPTVLAKLARMFTKRGN